MPQLSPMNWMMLSIMPLMIMTTFMMMMQSLQLKNQLTPKKIKTFLMTWAW